MVRLQRSIRQLAEGFGLSLQHPFRGTVGLLGVPKWESQFLSTVLLSRVPFKGNPDQDSL